MTPHVPAAYLATLDRECTFCRVLLGEMPARIVAEDELAIAFLDVKPTAPGHTLVVPKMHVERFPDLDHEMLAPLFALVQRVAVAAQTTVEAEGALVAVNVAVGQSVPHVHVHVVPRWNGDALEGCMSPHVHAQVSEDDRDRIAKSMLGELTVGSVPT